MKMRLDKLLSVLLLTSGLVLMPNGTWADEENSLDGSIPPPEENPTDEPEYTGLPTINASISSEEEFLIITATGISQTDVEGFLWDGIDATELIEQLVKDKVVQITEQDDGFQMETTIPIQALPGKHEFGIVYLGNNKLSTTVDSEQLLAEVADSDRQLFSYLFRVYGNVKYRTNCMFFGCWKNANGAKLYFYRWNSSSGWQYKGATTTDESGNYMVGFTSGRRLLVLVKYEDRYQRKTFFVPLYGVRADFRLNLADLIPVPDPRSSTSDGIRFCKLDDEMNLVVTVKNRGDQNAPASTTTVVFTKWEWTGSSGSMVPVSLDFPTPPISAGGSIDLAPISTPAGCYQPNCHFEITVDSENDVNESNGINNSVSGYCLG